MIDSQKQETLEKLATYVLGRSMERINNILSENIGSSMEEYNELLDELDEEGCDTTWLRTIDPRDFTITINSVDAEYNEWKGLIAGEGVYNPKGNKKKEW